MTQGGQRDARSRIDRLRDLRPSRGYGGFVHRRRSPEGELGSAASTLAIAADAYLRRNKARLAAAERRKPGRQAEANQAHRPRGRLRHCASRGGAKT